MCGKALHIEVCACDVRVLRVFMYSAWGSPDRWNLVEFCAKKHGVNFGVDFAWILGEKFVGQMAARFVDCFARGVPQIFHAKSTQFSRARFWPKITPNITMVSCKIHAIFTRAIRAENIFFTHSSLPCSVGVVSSHGSASSVSIRTNSEHQLPQPHLTLPQTTQNNSLLTTSTPGRTTHEDRNTTFHQSPDAVPKTYRPKKKDIFFFT